MWISMEEVEDVQRSYGEKVQGIATECETITYVITIQVIGL